MLNQNLANTEFPSAVVYLHTWPITFSLETHSLEIGIESLLKNLTFHVVIVEDNKNKKYIGIGELFLRID